MIEQEKLKELISELNVEQPTLILAIVCLALFDKVNECVERINKLEAEIGE